MSEHERKQARVCLEEDTTTDTDTGFREFSVLRSDLFYRPERLQQQQQAQRNAKNEETKKKHKPYGYIEKTAKSGYWIPFAVISLYVALWVIRPLNFDEALYIIQWVQWRLDFVEKLIIANAVFFILAGVIFPILDNAPDRYRVPKSIFACMVLVACLLVAPILYFLVIEMGKDISFFNFETVAFILFFVRGIALLLSFVVSLLICFVRVRWGRR